ncbi:MAG: hypothetical protein OEY79_01955 [Anaplasmataceae bacterium]|nr:hypothetical protein [Anaplasmataceae bacterium]
MNNILSHNYLLALIVFCISIFIMQNAEANDLDSTHGVLCTLLEHLSGGILAFVLFVIITCVAFVVFISGGGQGGESGLSSFFKIFLGVFFIAGSVMLTKAIFSGVEPDIDNLMSCAPTNPAPITPDTPKLLAILPHN